MYLLITSLVILHKFNEIKHMKYLWQLWRIDESSFNFRVFNKQFIGLNNQGSNVVAVSNTPDTTETFQIFRNNDKVRIKASNGQFLQVFYLLLVLDYTKFRWAK